MKILLLSSENMKSKDDQIKKSQEKLDRINLKYNLNCKLIVREPKSNYIPYWELFVECPKNLDKNIYLYLNGIHG